MSDKNRFRFWVPIEKIEKSVDENGKRVMKLSGFAMNDPTKKDFDGENIFPTGFDISYLKERGVANWNHFKSPEAVIGEPTVAEIRKGNLFIETQLYPESELANKVFDLAEVLNKNSKTRRLGYSIEGVATERDPLDQTKVLKAKITNYAITINPKHTQSVIDIVKGVFTPLEEEMELEKSAEDMLSNIETMKNALGGKTYLIDITTKDNKRITVDKEYNISIVEKSLSVESGRAVVKEDLDSEVKDQLKITKSTDDSDQISTKYLTKAEAVDRIIEKCPVISLEKAIEFVEILNESFMSTKKQDKQAAASNSTSNLTEDILNKAVAKLGLSKSVEDSTDESEEETEGIEKGSTAAPVDNLKKGSDDWDDDEEEEKEEGSEDNEEEEEKEEKKPAPAAKKKMEKSVTTAAIPAKTDNKDEVNELVKSVGVLVKGCLDQIGQMRSEMGELRQENEELKKAIDEMNDQPLQRKAVTRVVAEKSFQKGINEEEAVNNNGKKKISLKNNKTEILNILDNAAFEKGLNAEIAQSMTLFEGSGQLNKAAMDTLSARGFEVVM